MADDILEYNHAHVVPLSAAQSTSRPSSGLHTVSSTTSLSSLGSSSSTLSHMTAAARPSMSAAGSGRPTDVDYELFDIFQMASSYDDADDSSQLFRHSVPTSTDPLVPAQPLSPTGAMRQLSPPRPSRPPSSSPSVLASQHLQDAMLRQLAGSDQAAFLSLSPIPSPSSPLTSPSTIPLQPPTSMRDEAAVKREMLSPSLDTAHNRAMGLSPLSPQMISPPASASSTPSSSVSFHHSVPSRASPSTSPSASISPYAQLPPALLHQLLAQQHAALSYPASSTISPSLATAAAQPQPFIPYSLPSSPAGIPLAPHSHSTMQEDDEDDEDDEESDETDLPRAHKRTHLASPSSHVSALQNRLPVTRSTIASTNASDENEHEMKAEQKQQSPDSHTATDEHIDSATDPANASSASSPLSSAVTHNSRLSRKAELARASRKRKKMYVADLEEKVSKLAGTVEELQRKLKMNAGGLSKEERVRREQQSAIKERLTQLIAQTQAAEPSVATAAASDNTAAGVADTGDTAPAPEQQPMAATSSDSSSTAAPITVPVFVPEASYELQELVTRFVYNSRERQGHVDYYFDRVAHCLSPGLQVRFAMWGLTQPDEFYSSPGLWQSLMEGEIALDGPQMDWILSKRDAIQAERKNLQTCELMLRETRNAISMHLHSLHGHMDDLLSVMTPLQLAKFYLWVENNAWCMQMLPGLGG